MWACDYPHPDSTFPDSREVVERLMRDLSPAARKRVLRDNAETLYGLD
jgi:predicted TIM-barrel fold metal-dependent hydrolase